MSHLKEQKRELRLEPSNFWNQKRARKMLQEQRKVESRFGDKPPSENVVVPRIKLDPFATSKEITQALQQP